ncbi:Na/Pi cotransporter family protein [bacterium]|nr:Na/Pi cotransporter family protein [bacterium]MCK4437235.1 Na/Pi cotransporter family protein [bacterium]
MGRELVFGLIGGLGLFFFGMKLLSDGLRKVAGERVRRILQLLIKTPVIGVLVGAAVTCIIQSSSATTVMTVGLVNAGLMGLRQAISVVMGANIGTTVTAWLVSLISFMEDFKITHFALPIIGIGFAVSSMGRSRKSKLRGQVLLGFGILFLGLSFMKGAFQPYHDSPAVQKFFESFSRNPLLGVLAGMVVTMLFQSSSVTIAIIAVMAFQGLISFPAAIPLILGDNIGTTITAELAAMGTNVPARRTARAHTMFNVIGVAWMFPLVQSGWYARAIDAVIPGPIVAANVMFAIALAHSAFNIVNTIIFLPLIGLLERVSVKIVPGAAELAAVPRYLEKHLLDTPPMAFEQARREIVRMAEVARGAVKDAMDGFLNNDVKSLNRVASTEEAIDNLQTEITQYLVELSQRNLSEEESQELPVFLHSVNDIERIGDHAENLVELAQRKIEERLPFTDLAIAELKGMYSETSNMIEDVITALRANDKTSARRALKREDRVNQLQIELRQNHIQRLNKGACKVLSGIVFLDFVNNLEKIGDHLTNIAQAVMGSLRWERAAE